MYYHRCRCYVPTKPQLFKVRARSGQATTKPGKNKRPQFSTVLCYATKTLPASKSPSHYRQINIEILWENVHYMDIAHARTCLPARHGIIVRIDGWFEFQESCLSCQDICYSPSEFVRHYQRTQRKCLWWQIWSKFNDLSMAFSERNSSSSFNIHLRHWWEQLLFLQCPPIDNDRLQHILANYFK